MSWTLQSVRTKERAPAVGSVEEEKIEEKDKKRQNISMKAQQFSIPDLYFYSFVWFYLIIFITNIFIDSLL